MDNVIRIIVIDISAALGAEVYDEIIIPVNEANDFANKYTDITKYRIITV